MESLKAEKEELESTFNKEQLQNLQIKQELAEAESRNTELTKASFISVLYQKRDLSKDKMISINKLYIISGLCRSFSPFVVSLLLNSQGALNLRYACEVTDNLSVWMF